MRRSISAQIKDQVIQYIELLSIIDLLFKVLLRDYFHVTCVPRVFLVVSLTYEIYLTANSDN